MDITQVKNPIIILKEDGLHRVDISSTFLGPQTDLLKDIQKEPSLAISGECFGNPQISGVFINSKTAVVAQNIEKLPIKSRFTHIQNGDGSAVIVLAASGYNADKLQPEMTVEWDVKVGLGPEFRLCLFTVHPVVLGACVNNPQPYLLVLDKKQNVAMQFPLPNVHSDGSICSGEGNRIDFKNSLNFVNNAIEVKKRVFASSYNDHLVDGNVVEGHAMVRFKSEDITTVPAPSHWRKYFPNVHVEAVAPTFVIPFLK